ncbi:hypothetical protein [Aliiruegeria sabulilitoris]|uniref:hypothetical protein n=1 Tax=Aliiruegeria sabulilitoris TaxID=1510458 RepID=UPI0012E3B36B|nr:hypothetical protein [Aliiruegeria sabulilitoris]NDR56539.1 hypothetical protein [Pseudoruegeria sp. M32A2M]
MRRLSSAVAVGGFLTMSSLAAAQDMAPVEAAGYGGTADSGWTYQLQLYIWGTEVGGVANGNDFDIGFDTLVENLNFALMGGLKAYNGNWMSYGELGYAALGYKDDATINTSIGVDIDVDLDTEVKSTVVSFGGGYRVINEPNYTMYVTGGARYLRLDSTIQLKVANQKLSLESDDDYWDAVVGLQGEARFNENWFMPWVLDVGAGQSDLTWQAGLGVGYRFGRNDIVFGYRHMEWELPDDDMVTNYYQSGPMLLWNFRF